MEAKRLELNFDSIDLRFNTRDVYSVAHTVFRSAGVPAVLHCRYL